jgi:hypothetical protein
VFDDGRLGDEGNDAHLATALGTQRSPRTEDPVCRQASSSSMRLQRRCTGIPRAVPAEGLVFGLSSHRAEHWWFFDGGTSRHVG